MHRGIAIGIGLALALSGAVLMFTPGSAKVPRYWEQADGVVLSSEVRETGGRRFAEIRFEYEVGGRKVLARQLHFTPGEVDKAPGELPRGKKVKVWFDPAKPEQSRLVAAEGANWRWIASAVLLGGGLGLALHGARRRKAPAPGGVNK